MEECGSRNCEKLRKACGKCRILMWVCIALLFLVFIFGIIVTFLYLGNEEQMLQMAIGVGSDMICVILLLAACFIADGILKRISKGETPFTYYNADKLRLISILLLVSFVITTVFQAILMCMPDNEYEVSFSWELLISGLAIYVISMIFRYGTMLQIQSDETV